MATKAKRKTKAKPDQTLSELVLELDTTQFMKALDQCHNRVDELWSKWREVLKTQREIAQLTTQAMRKATRRT